MTGPTRWNSSWPATLRQRTSRGVARLARPQGASAPIGLAASTASTFACPARRRLLRRPRAPHPCHGFLDSGVAGRSVFVRCLVFELGRITPQVRSPPLLGCMARDSPAPLPINFWKFPGTPARRFLWFSMTPTNCPQERPDLTCPKDPSFIHCARPFGAPQFVRNLAQRKRLRDDRLPASEMISRRMYEFVGSPSPYCHVALRRCRPFENRRHASGDVRHAAWPCDELHRRLGSSPNGSRLSSRLHAVAERRSSMCAAQPMAWAHCMSIRGFAKALRRVVGLSPRTTAGRLAETPDRLPLLPTAVPASSLGATGWVLASPCCGEHPFV